MPSYRRLQQYAIVISIISVIYNGLEGGLSIGFGAESGSRSLIFFGIQSGVEVISAFLVLWRFRKVAKPGEERGAILSEQDLRFERAGTLGIGLLLIALALATIASAIDTLVTHQEPDLSNASLIISASALFLMVLIWLPKRYLAKALDSSTMRGEATCSLSCIQITGVLFVGSLIFRAWHGGWWVDGATSLILSFLFAWEGIKMVLWARSSEFTGGCCESCQIGADVKGDAELGEVYRDICECCLEKESCRNSNECKCSDDDGCSGSGDRQAKTNTRCSSTGTKCCTREIILGPRTPAPTGQAAASVVVDHHAQYDTKTEPEPELVKVSPCCDGCHEA